MNDKGQSANAKVEYTFDMFLTDILISSEEMGEEFERECMPKKIVTKMLVQLAADIAPECYANDEKLNSYLETKVYCDGLLSGYMFYVSQNPHFDYSWSYMRKRMRDYIEFLANTLRFLNNVVTDIRLLVNTLGLKDNMHVVFNDIFDVSVISQEPYVNTKVLWENFHLLPNAGKDYGVCIKINESVLLASSEKKDFNFGKLICSALKILDKAENIQKSNSNETER